MQMYDHTNIVEAMQQYLDREGYPVKGYVDQQEGIEVSLVSVGTKSMPQDGIDYIGKDGSYYKLLSRDVRIQHDGGNLQRCAFQTQP